jgi:hypothetical protein
MANAAAEARAARAKKQAEKAAEKLATAERQAHFHLLQQKQKLMQVVEQRLTSCRYIQTAHSKSSSFWLSSVLITSSDIVRYSLAEVPFTKCVSLYYLSISLDKLLERFTFGTNCHAYTKLQSFSQLFEEWEYYGGGTAMQSMRLVMAKHAASIHPATLPQQQEIANTQEPVRASIFKFNGNIVFEHLLTPYVPLDLYYSDVIVGLSDSLQGMYSLFSYQEEEYWRQNALFDSFIKLDKRVKEFYVSACMKELTTISARACEDAFELIRSGIP